MRSEQSNLLCNSALIVGSSNDILIPTINLLNAKKLQGFFLRFFLTNAASTSSFLIRAVGFPRSLRFCSSVPSPIIPG